MKKILKIIFKIIVILILIVVAYLAYMHFNFYRIEDNLDISENIKNNREETLAKSHEYTIITNNFGFGAHDKDFSFFMDTGVMKDGTPVRGELSVASSKEKVEENTNKLIEFLNKEASDFIILQEVDTDSTRGFKVNQCKMIEESLKDYASIFDCNLHVPYLMYPITDPHGYANSGLLSFSKYKMNSATHRQLYISDGFIDKFIDLDRCFTTMRFPTDDKNELVLINLHLSAYDKGGKSREKQMDFLMSVMNEEYKKGNYVIVGGDFNHMLSDKYKPLKTEQKKPAWVFLFPKEKLSKNFSIVHSENADDIGTCRTSDLPYKEGVNYRVRVDGFIISDNIEASSEIIDNDFEFTDHNPVKMKFKLK